MSDSTLTGIRVVVVNWRDRGHPLAGGAEEYAERMARSLASAGADVTFLTARAPGQSRGALAHRVRTVRRGGRWTVYLWALAWLVVHRRRLDVVLDCQNGIPFFSPLVVRRHTAVLLVMHHVHDTQFGVHFPAPLARVGRLLEGPGSRWAYRRAVTVAVSPSTVRAMRERLNWTGPVYVVPNGLDRPNSTAGARADVPSLVCLGRLVVHKRVDRLIELTEQLARRWPGLRLDVIGGGPDEPRLRAMAERAVLAGVAVRVHGYLDEAAKSRLLDAAWANVTLSDGEGWGLAVLEAAAHGVPTVCRSVDGLRDSVRDGETGWLVGPDDDLLETLDQVLGKIADPAAAAEVAGACRSWAARFDWDASGERLVRLVSSLRGQSMVEGWRPGQHEALIARFAPPADRAALVAALLRTGVGPVTDAVDGVLAEQHPAGDLVAALHRAGVTDVRVRAAGDVERLLGTAVADRPDAG